MKRETAKDKGKKSLVDHFPVMTKEVLENLDIKKGDIVLDGTLGGGGHSEAILEKIGPKGFLIGIDLDEDAIKRGQERLKLFENKFLFEGNFKDIDSFVLKAGLMKVDKILADLGFSSFEMEDKERGFSFQKDGPLKMTFKKSPSEEDTTAYEVVNDWKEETLAQIIWSFGEERFSRKIAKAIVEYREKKKIETTGELADIVRSAVKRKGKIDSATKTFQALRIAVNKEVENLNIFLEKSFRLLKEGGRVAIISFHSIEDRIVKRALKDKEKEGLIKIITKKPITPSKEEILINKKSRSAKLRVFQKIKDENI